jgi:antigen flippase
MKNTIHENKSEIYKLLEATFISSSGVFLASVFRLVQTKIFAVFLGPDGIGIFFILIQFINLVGLLPLMGLNNSAVKFISEFRSKNDMHSLTSTISSIRTLVLPLAFLVMIGVILFSVPLASWLIPTHSPVGLLLMFSVAIFFLSTRNIFNKILLGFKEIRRHTVITVIPVMVSATAAFPLVWYFGLYGAALVYLIAVATEWLLGFYLYRKTLCENRIIPTWRVDRMLSKRLIKFGLTAQGVDLMVLASNFLVPYILVLYSGPGAIGIYQVLMVFTGFTLLLQSSMFAYFFPKISESESDEWMGNRINDAVRVQLLLTIPIVSLLVLFSSSIVRLVYTAEFMGASDYMALILFSSLGAALGSTNGFAMLGSGKMRIYTIQNLIKALVSIALAIVLVPTMKTAGALIAYSGGPIAAAIYGHLALRRSIGYEMSMRNWMLLVSGALIVLLIYFFDRSAGIVIVGLILVVMWIFFVFDNKEWRKLMSGASELTGRFLCYLGKRVE